MPNLHDTLVIIRPTGSTMLDPTCFQHLFAGFRFMDDCCFDTILSV
jgi:hypothetical protein